MRIRRGKRSTRRKPATVPLCPPQIPHDLTRAAAVGSRRLTAWAIARTILRVSHWIFIGAKNVSNRVVEDNGPHIARPIHFSRKSCISRHKRARARQCATIAATCVHFLTS
jgi:hypothetical protein